jgi:hypothetical protein
LRITVSEEGIDSGMDVPELRVPVRVTAPGAGLRGSLQRVAHLVQQLAHGGRADRVPRGGQLLGQVTERGSGPAQRRGRIAELGRLDQRVQRCLQSGIGRGQRLATTARRALSAQDARAPAQLVQPAADGGGGHTGRRGYRGDPAVLQRLRLRAQIQTALPLVQMR